jgi:hypothetical protein
MNKDEKQIPPLEVSQGVQVGSATTLTEIRVS